METVNELIQAKKHLIQQMYVILAYIGLVLFTDVLRQLEFYF